MTGGLLQAAFYILPSEVSLSFYEKALILSRLFLHLSENIFQTENWSERGKRTRRKWIRRYQKSVERTSKWFWFGALRICCWRYSSRNLQFWINATTTRRGVFRRQDFIRLWLTLDFNTFTYQTWNQGSLDRVIWTVKSLLSDYWLSKIFSRLVYLWNYSFFTVHSALYSSIWSFEFSPADVAMFDNFTTIRAAVIDSLIEKNVLVAASESGWTCMGKGFAIWKLTTALAFFLCHWIQGWRR